MRDFENDNIVLNPYNTSNDRNGYNEVKMDNKIYQTLYL